MNSISFLDLKKLGGDFAHLEKALETKNSSVFSLAAGSKSHIVSCLDRFVLYVTADRLAAKSAAERLEGYAPGKVAHIAERDDVLLHRKAFSHENVTARIDALAKIVSGEVKSAVISAEGLLQLFPGKERFSRSLIKLSENEEYETQGLSSMLTDAGYLRVETVTERGEFALRGDIADIFPVNAKRPVRLSFFDTLLEEIKEFDIETMVSKKKLSSIVIAPASDILIGEDEAEAVSEKLKEFEKSEGRVREIASDLLFRLSVRRSDPSYVWLLPFIRKSLSNIFEYIPSNAIVCFDEPKLVFDKLELYALEHKRRVESLVDAAEALPEHKKALLSVSEAKEAYKNMRLLSFGQISSSNPLFDPKSVFNIKTQAVTKYYLDFQSLVTDLKNYLWNGRKVALCAGDAGKAKAIADNLRQEDIPVEIADDFTSGKSIIASTLGIKAGFNIPSSKLVVVGVDELVGKPRQKTEFRQKQDFIAPKAGDYVVHSVHGIGVCTGITRLKIDDIEKEFVTIAYRDGDKLYVATDQMGMLEKWSGSGAPHLSKMGGKEFARVKERVKQSVKKLAIDLLKLYADRERARGFKYSPDTEWQKEFEDNFEYTETPDQMEAINTIKEEMEKGKVVDRLICGDVGYGKTEVAIRAMFKTIMDNKQAALLAPTTILARQHYNTIAARLEPFGIRCEILSRFQGTKENKGALERLKDGTSLLAVATHRLLSKDVKFHNLGLLVLDEEQRFGVQHKEKLKLTESNVNVLTMSATPIPRTLNMALSGIRDVSLLETPPVGRLPIQTYITEYSDGLVKDAVERELSRGGQVFILYNRVETIDSFAAHVSALFKGSVRILVAHGQLRSDLFEERVSKFYNGEADVLIATTIIENGIDLPSANTLIVCEADMFGLAQLYQLRGRVGRSGTLAHAYFTTRPGKVLSDDGMKRLTALMDNTEFGSGFKIAMRDLEIRGAGSILGAEQHGHIERVGYQMYLKLLEESVRELQGGKTKPDWEVELKIDANMYIRNTYVSERDKLRIYKKMSSVSTFAERDNLLTELTDMYGPPDRPLLNLVDVALMKNLAEAAGVKKIVINKQGAGLSFADNNVFQNADILAAVSVWKEKAVLTSTIPPQMIFDVGGLSSEEKIQTVLDFFKDITGSAR